jgi:hypothetical protein
MTNKYDYLMKAGVCHQCATTALDPAPEKIPDLHRDCMRALLHLTKEPVKLNDPSSLVDLKHQFNPDLNPGMQLFNILLAHEIH